MLPLQDSNVSIKVVLSSFGKSLVNMFKSSIVESCLGADSSSDSSFVTDSGNSSGFDTISANYGEYWSFFEVFSSIEFQAKS